MNQTEKIYFPNLDGLRFFAFFAVFINHAVVSLGYFGGNKPYDFAKENLLKNGDLGVSFFFVLSGFLITYLLLSEKANRGSINIKHFYFRRILRIWPVYFLVVTLCLWVFPLLHNHIPEHFPIGVSTSSINKWLYIGFAGNFDYVFHGISNVLIGVLWSVSVEEQFYLFWPLVIAFIPRKYLLATFLLIISASVAFRYFYADGAIMIIKFHSLSSMSDLATGALIAYLATHAAFIERFKTISGNVIKLVYLVAIIIMPLRLYLWKLGAHYTLGSSFFPVVFSLIFAFMVMEQNYAQHSFYKISRWKIISSLGQYTYGMYCYHMIVFFCIIFAMHLLGANVWCINYKAFICLSITSLFTTILVSMLSYHFFERFFLKLKNKFS